MSNRDELEAELNLYLPGYLEGAESDIPADHLAECLADWLHDEGWRKPRTITTIEELDELPIGSVVRSSLGTAATRRAGANFSWHRLALPALVLWVPEAEQ